VDGRSCGRKELRTKRVVDGTSCGRKKLWTERSCGRKEVVDEAGSRTVKGKVVDGKDVDGNGIDRLPFGRDQRDQRDRRKPGAQARSASLSLFLQLSLHYLLPQPSAVAASNEHPTEATTSSQLELISLVSTLPLHLTMRKRELRASSEEQVPSANTKSLHSFNNFSQSVRHCTSRIVGVALLQCWGVRPRCSSGVGIGVGSGVEDRVKIE